MEFLRDNYWISKSYYEKAETEYYENLAKASVTPLAGEVAKARQLLRESRDLFKDRTCDVNSADPEALKFFEKQMVEMAKNFNQIMDKLNNLEIRVGNLENKSASAQPAPIAKKPAPKADNDDDDVDLFGSDSDEDNEAANKIREERLAAYNAKKAKKPVLIAKSNVILDIKPWDDETDMKVLEAEVRKITKDGLLWGAAKLVPLAYGIHKLQISCVVEDEKISIDELQEDITAIEDYVQSVDIAAFNKI